MKFKIDRGNADSVATNLRVARYCKIAPSKAQEIQMLTFDAMQICFTTVFYLL